MVFTSMLFFLIMLIICNNLELTDFWEIFSFEIQEKVQTDDYIHLKKHGFVQAAINSRPPWNTYIP